MKKGLICHVLKLVPFLAGSKIIGIFSIGGSKVIRKAGMEHLWVPRYVIAYTSEQIAPKTYF